MDNKPLEELAENYIKVILGEGEINYLKPNYDKDGSDLVLLHRVNRHYSREVIVQSKGRDVTNNASNVKISSSYVTSNFICFLYIKNPDKKRYFYIFYKEDISQWNISDNNYILQIPKKFHDNEYFIDHEFKEDTDINKIKELLENGPLVNKVYNSLDSMSSLEIYFELWKKYNSIPDETMAHYLFDNYEQIETFNEEIFLLFLLIKYRDSLDYKSPDFMVNILYHGINTSKPIIEILTIINPENLTKVSLNYCYPYGTYGTVNVIYDGIEYRSLYTSLGDRENDVEAILFENGDYLIYGQHNYIK